MSLAKRILNIGIIGCGEVAQVIHIPTIGFLSDFMRITFLCDVSDRTLEHVKQRVVNNLDLQTTRDPAHLCSSSDVDVVFVLSSDEYHADHAILALKNNKFVMIEKPAALNLQDLRRLKEAEAASIGKVMIGYMRRYALAFKEAVTEIGGLEEIMYVRVRDIIGQPQPFVAQSGTFPKRFTDFRSEDTQDLKRRQNDMVNAALVECHVEPTDQKRLFWKYLGGLGSHDLSAMRELLGMPLGVHGVAVTMPFWNVLFKYPNFTVSYESGIDEVPRFDAHIEVYGRTKTVKIEYDTPYVKGLPTMLYVAENSRGVYKETKTRVTYEDSYTQELMELYDWVTTERTVKTTLDDAEKDLDIMAMVLKMM